MSGDPAPAKPEAPRRSGAWPLWLVFAISAAPIVAAWFAYFVWPPASRVNYGELIAPTPLPDPALRTDDGRAFRLSELRGKWLLVHVGPGRCAEACRRRLVYSRQVRLAQGRESARIERVWLVTDDVPVDPALERQHEGLHTLRGAGAALLAAFPPDGARAAHVYVVDPLGNVMLRFPPDPDPNGMKKDLSRLLRASRIG